MARRTWTRVAMLSAAAAVMGLVGCSTSDVTLTNASDSLLNVRFFVETTSGSNRLVSNRKFEVRPGQSARFAVRRPPDHGELRALVHMQVQPVRPSWEGSGQPHWLELLAGEPVRIIARGTADDLELESSAGSLMPIPGRQIEARYKHQIAISD